jgi:hypothetical protein
MVVPSSANENAGDQAGVLNRAWRSRSSAGGDALPGLRKVRFAL